MEEKFCRRIQKGKCWETEKKKIVGDNGTGDECAAAVDEEDSLHHNLPDIAATE